MVSVEPRKSDGSLLELKDKLDQVVAHHHAVGERMAASEGLGTEERVKLLKEYA